MNPTSALPQNASSVQDQIHELEKVSVRTVGRKATITKEELFQAALNLIGQQKSISSLSL